MATQRRTFRVGERIRERISTELQQLSDPRLGIVTITSVVTSPDLRHAKVYWMVGGGKERIDEVEEALESARPVFRRALASSLGVRFVPELRFYYDDTLDTQEKIQKLMERARAMSPQESSDVTPSDVETNDLPGADTKER